VKVAPEGIASSLIDESSNDSRYAVKVAPEGIVALYGDAEVSRILCVIMFEKSC